MVLSTANIYFTTHDEDGATVATAGSQPPGARVFRTAASASPGQETELCYEQGSRFGDIVYANVDGVFYGYFFALTGAATDVKVNGMRVPSGTTTIRQVRLDETHQAAEVIGHWFTDIDIVSSHGNLVTDGSFLYWQSDNAINKMHIQTGEVTSLDATTLTRPVAGLYLFGPNLIYAVDRVVHYVAADGSSTTVPAERVVFTADAGVVASALLTEEVAGELIYAADRNGGIVVHSANGTSVAQVPGTAFITSMGGAFAWTQMAADQIAPGEIAATWQLRINTFTGNDFTFTTGANPRLATVNDNGFVYWLDDDGVVTIDQSVI
jgi:hypothetical protein